MKKKHGEGTPPAASDFEAKVAEAGKIMRQDRDVLRALAKSDFEAQIAVSRKVMARRRTALRKLAD